MTRQKVTGRRIAAIVAAFLLPPLAVFLERGLGSQFWIATVLTVLAFVPGVIFALYTIFIDAAGDAGAKETAAA
ncbi:YqaE/Pmp3 family membrane protein [Sphingomonas gilva]|uniref:YqaE/Pmp3 family membrane protein n=1 Tax=Sphingomonas gilva TaxID=2305907 RepID=A0A396RQY2_9SPHN|nr:YqaE/Pmp3 family membrane protein [Sphingomonas gilva]RHW18789.1 YqaE/Pmp3 family membrane protein [Sphingomonas gilva]